MPTLPLQSCAIATRHGRSITLAPVLVLGGMLAGTCPSSAWAQRAVPVLAEPALDPVSAGEISELFRLADGRYLVTGSYTRLGAAPVAGCARLRTDGSRDPTFSCGVAAVSGFAEDAQGRVLVRAPGAFGVQRLLANGAPDPSFAAISTDASIAAILPDGDALVLCGVFSTVNGQPRSGLARVDADGVLDPAWVPSVTGGVQRCTLAGDGFVYLGGTFTAVAAQPRTGLARVHLSSGNVDGWSPVLSSGGALSVDGMVHANGTLFVSGSFNQVQGQPRARLARIGLDPAASLDPDWAPEVLSGPSSSGPALWRVDPAIYLGSTSGDHIVRRGAITHSGRLLRLAGSGTGAPDPSFNPLADVGTDSGGARQVVPGDGGGRLFIGGPLRALSQGQVRLGLAALNPDGSVDTLSALVESLSGARIDALPADPVSGALYPQGTFIKVNGVLRPHLLRVRSDGGVDSSFRPPQRRYTAAAFTRNALYVADDTDRVLRRLDPISGDPDPAFTPIAYTGSLVAIHPADQHLYLYGSYTLAGISPTLARHARLNLESGQIDTGYRITPNAGASINGQSFDPVAQQLYLHGSFTQLNGVDVTRLARLDLNTLQVDASFTPQVPTALSAILYDGQGGLWLSGGFSTVNGQTCRTPARLLVSTAQLDPGFSCARAPQASGALAFALDGIYSGHGTRALRYPLALGGVPDPDWSVTLGSGTAQFQVQEDRLLIHGQFDVLGGIARNALGAVPLREFFHADGFESP